MKFQETLADVILDDNDALLRLIREVYNKGVTAGMQVAEMQDCESIFNDWEEVETALTYPITSIEDFVDEALDPRYRKW